MSDFPYEKSNRNTLPDHCGTPWECCCGTTIDTKKRFTEGSRMISFRPWLICLTSKSAFLCCLLIALVGSPADVSAKWKWKDVSADEAVIKLKGWPAPVDQCRLRIGTPPDFRKENTIFFCPRWVGSDEPRTYFRLIEMIPGWRWGGSYGSDFSEQPMFTKWSSECPQDEWWGKLDNGPPESS
jgi:hypothetical protein